MNDLDRHPNPNKLHLEQNLLPPHHKQRLNQILKSPRLKNLHSEMRWLGRYHWKLEWKKKWRQEKANQSRILVMKLSPEMMINQETIRWIRKKNCPERSLEKRSRNISTKRGKTKSIKRVNLFIRSLITLSKISFGNLLAKQIDFKNFQL